MQHPSTHKCPSVTSCYFRCPPVQFTLSLIRKSVAGHSLPATDSPAGIHRCRRAGWSFRPGRNILVVFRSFHIARNTLRLSIPSKRSERSDTQRQLAMPHCFLHQTTPPEWPPGMALAYPCGSPSPMPFSAAGSDESRRWTEWRCFMEFPILPAVYVTFLSHV